MAVVEMGKLNLVGMSYERDGILNALQRTNATEVKLHSETENTITINQDCEQLSAYLKDAESALEVLSSCVEKYYKEAKEKTDCLDGVEVTYTEFMSAKDM